MRWSVLRASLILCAVMIGTYVAAWRFGIVADPTMQTFVVLGIAVGATLAGAGGSDVLSHRRAQAARIASGPPASRAQTCWRCSYSLAGLETDLCPECGATVVAAGVLRELAGGVLSSDGPARCAVCKEPLADPSPSRCPSCGSRFREALPASKA